MRRANAGAGTCLLLAGRLVRGLALVGNLCERLSTLLAIAPVKSCAGLERYGRQVAIYATAVRKANDAQSEAFLLRV